MITACKLFFQGSPYSNRNFMVALPKMPEDNCININGKGGFGSFWQHWNTQPHWTEARAQQFWGGVALTLAELFQIYTMAARSRVRLWPFKRAHKTETHPPGFPRASTPPRQYLFPALLTFLWHSDVGPASGKYFIYVVCGWNKFMLGEGRAVLEHTPSTRPFCARQRRTLAALPSAAAVSPRCAQTPSPPAKDSRKALKGLWDADPKRETPPSQKEMFQEGYLAPISFCNQRILLLTWITRRCKGMKPLWKQNKLQD